MQDKEVMTIEWVEARFTVPAPPRLGVPQLVVTAMGAVPTLGWTHARLVQRQVRLGNARLEFDFVATPPTGVAGDIVSTITASVVVPGPTEGIREVVVYAAQGHKAAPVSPVVPVLSTPTP
jgi:hypothetical protein